MGLEIDVDLEALARRVVARLRPSPELRADLIQQAVVIGIELMQRFQPQISPDALPPSQQAERYLYVSLLRRLRAYSRDQRLPMVVSDRDHRLVRSYYRLIAMEGALPLNIAAERLAVKPERLALALRSTTSAVSLDHSDTFTSDGEATSIGERVAAPDGTPEEIVVAAIDRDRIARRKRPTQTDDDTKVGRRQQIRRLLYGLLDNLTDGDAEIIRLAFGLPRRELEALRSCRAYGCRRDGGHEHTPLEIARWVGADTQTVSRRMAGALDELEQLLGNRDPRRVIRAISAGPVGSTPSSQGA